MKGIILKDLYENFRIFKNGVSYLAAVLFLFLLIEAMQTGDLFSLKYFFMLITAFVFPLLGCSSIESSLEQDDFAGRAVCMGVRSSFLPCLFCSR